MMLEEEHMCTFIKEFCLFIHIVVVLVQPVKLQVAEMIYLMSFHVFKLKSKRRNSNHSMNNLVIVQGNSVNTKGQSPLLLFSVDSPSKAMVTEPSVIL